MSQRRPEKKASIFRRYENMTPFSILAGFAITIVLLQLITNAGQGTPKFPTFILPVNLFNIMMQVAVPGIVAVGMMMVIISGGIDLSVGMLSSLVGIFVALGVSKWSLGAVPAMLLGILLAVVCEAIMGFIISRTNVEPFIISLGGMIAFQGVALLLCNSREVVLNNEFDFFKTNLIAGAKDPVNGLNLTIPIYVIIFLVIVVLLWAVMRFTTFGRRVYAVGSNKNAAYLSGVNVKNMKLMIYMLHGLLVGIASVLLLARVNVGIITLGQSMEIDAIAMAVIGGTAMSGGKGNVWGTFFGVLLLGSIGNAMNMLRLPSEVQYVAKGVIIIMAVTAPYISSSMSNFLAKFRGKDSNA